MVIWSQEGFMLLRLFLAALLVLCMEARKVETTLLGQVSAHGTPIAGAIITISKRTFLKSVTTDNEGRFMIPPVPPGRYTLRLFFFFKQKTAYEIVEKRLLWVI